MNQRNRQLELSLLAAIALAAVAIGFAYAWHSDLQKATDRANRLYIERDQWIRNYQQLREGER